MRLCPWWYYLSSTTWVPTARWCETTSSRERYSLWHSVGQGFTEHICRWNKHRGERKIPSPKPRGFTPHSPALSTFCRSAGTRPQNSIRIRQTPVCLPRRTSQKGRFSLSTAFIFSSFSFPQKKMKIISSTKKWVLWAVTNKFKLIYSKLLAMRNQSVVSTENCRHSSNKFTCWTVFQTRDSIDRDWVCNKQCSL